MQMLHFLRRLVFISPFCPFFKKLKNMFVPSLMLFMRKMLVRKKNNPLVIKR